MRRSIEIMSIILLTALATTFVGANGFGIQKIRFFDMTENQVNISIRYVDCSGYSVKYVQDDDVLYHGELPKSLDEYLPSNRIRITLSDCKMTEKIKTQYSAWTVYDADCENEDICFMWLLHPILFCTLMSNYIQS